MTPQPPNARDDALGDYGYDPTLDAGLTARPVAGVASPPSAARVTQAFLPPVGEQGTPAALGTPGTCTAWASTYGLATFTAAKRTNTAPSSPADYASPAAIYIQVKKVSGHPAPPCAGSSYKPYFDILASRGAATLQSAPYTPDCDTLTSEYADGGPPPDSRFVLAGATPVHTADLVGLKQLLAANCPIAYATSLYRGWGAYRGDPPVYVGAPPLLTKADGQPVGHCMLIIGYDDTKAYDGGSGAFCIQNSEGTDWGASGYVWMAYPTFSALAQPIAFYYQEPGVSTVVSA